ncbi:MAG: hypothetical protein ACRENP_23155 [Longimicrobiales bacterium]
MRIADTRLVIASLLLQFATVEAASAQAPRQITLDQAKQIAWERNPAVRRAETERTTADLRRRQAQNSVFIPQFGSSLNFSRLAGSAGTRRRISRANRWRGHAAARQTARVKFDRAIRGQPGTD